MYNNSEEQLHNNRTSTEFSGKEGNLSNKIDTAADSAVKQTAKKQELYCQLE
jgi:hypothetical protein